MSLRNLLGSFVAGLAGTAAHVVLMLLKTQLGLVPQFQPYAELQRGVALLTGATPSPTAVYLLTFVNGALVWGFVFGRIFRFLPGVTPLRKGLFFAFCAWTISGLVMFPLLGRGPFAWNLGLGTAPAALMLVMLSVYSLAMSFSYAALAGRDGISRP
jgi:hypothetical protein